MTEHDLQTVVRHLVTKLAGGDYEGVVAECSASRLSSDVIRQVVSDYGKTFVVPPTDAYSDLDAVLVRNTAEPTWSVRAPLWSKEEGRSDLELQLTISQRGDQQVIEIDDLLVP